MSFGPSRLAKINLRLTEASSLPSRIVEPSGFDILPHVLLLRSLEESKGDGCILKHVIDKDSAAGLLEKYTRIALGEGHAANRRRRMRRGEGVEGEGGESKIRRTCVSWEERIGSYNCKSKRVRLK